MPNNAKNTWTSDALVRGDADAIKKRVLEDPEYIHERDYVDSTPLLNAIEFNHLDLVKFLLNKGADPNIKVSDGYTCLLSAVENEGKDSLLILDELLQAGADIHAEGINGWTALHLAAARGKAEMAASLIAAGADVNRRTKIDGTETPLMEAAYCGHSSIVRLLLEHGADPLMQDCVNHQTPLEMAKEVAKGPDLEVADELKKENLPIDVDNFIGDMDLPDDQIEFLKEAMNNINLGQSYVDRLNELKDTGNHAEIIRILSEYRQE